MLCFRIWTLGILGNPSEHMATPQTKGKLPPSKPRYFIGKSEISYKWAIFPSCALLPEVNGLK